MTGAQPEHPWFRRRHAPRAGKIRPASLVGFDGFGREVVWVADATHSDRVGQLLHCGGLVLIPAEAGHLPAGMPTEFLPFGEA